ncbi:MAG: hypothetical protein WDW38_007996 [Sanguina aurantia]
MRPDYHVQMLDWANQYGGIYRFCLGQQYIVVVTDPAMVAQLLGRGEGSAPRKCVAYQFFDLATNHLGTHSFFTTSDEQQWGAMRKAAAPAFSAANVKRAFPSALRHAQAVSDIVASHGPDSPVEFQHHLEILMLHVFVEALWGIEPTAFPGEEVAAAMNLVLEEANERLKVPLRQLYCSWVHPQEERAVRKAQCFLGEVYGGMADSLRERDSHGGWPEGDTSMAACMSRLKCRKTGKPYTREQLIPEIGALMMAGFDTSSHSVAWALFTIASLPHVQNEIHQELQEAGLLGKTGRPLQYEDLFRLTYLNAVIDETMRMYPVAATASVRELTSTTTLGKYKLPAGVLVWPMLYALHNSKHNWQSPGPEVFEPKRWLKTSSPDSSMPSTPSPERTATPANGTATSPPAATAATGHSVTFADQQPANRAAADAAAAAVPPHQGISSNPDGASGLQHGNGSVDFNTTPDRQRQMLAQHLKSLQPPGSSHPRAKSGSDDGGADSVECEEDAQARIAAAEDGAATAAEPAAAGIASHPFIMTPNGTCYSLNNSRSTSLGSDTAWPDEFGNSPGSAAAAVWQGGGVSPDTSPTDNAAEASPTSMYRPGASTPPLLRKRVRHASNENGSSSNSIPSILDQYCAESPAGSGLAGATAGGATAAGADVSGGVEKGGQRALGRSPSFHEVSSNGAPKLVGHAGGSAAVTLASAPAPAPVMGGRAAPAGLPASGSSTSSDEGLGVAASKQGAGGGSSSSSSSRRSPKNFLPFSDGPKSCLGQALGLMEVRTVLATLLSRYDFALDPSLGGPKAVHASMIMSLTLKIKGGLRLLGTPL